MPACILKIQTKSSSPHTSWFRFLPGGTLNCAFNMDWRDFQAAKVGRGHSAKSQKGTSSHFSTERRFTTSIGLSSVKRLGRLKHYLLGKCCTFVKPEGNIHSHFAFDFGRYGHSMNLLLGPNSRMSAKIFSCAADIVRLISRPTRPRSKAFQKWALAMRKN